jgi:hypothetical protein
MPHDIAILRPRDNSKPFKSTIRVAKERGISVETVRAIENRSLDDLADGVDLEAAGQPITAMRLAKAFKQPVASLIC